LPTLLRVVVIEQTAWLLMKRPSTSASAVEAMTLVMIWLITWMAPSSGGYLELVLQYTNFCNRNIPVTGPS
jgi:hypothetical protein